MWMIKLINRKKQSKLVDNLRRSFLLVYFEKKCFSFYQSILFVLFLFELKDVVNNIIFYSQTYQILNEIRWLVLWLFLWQNLFVKRKHLWMIYCKIDKDRFFFSTKRLISRLFKLVITFQKYMLFCLSNCWKLLVKYLSSNIHVRY